MKPVTVILIALITAILASFATVKLTAPQTASIISAPKESAYDRVMRTGTIHCGYATSPPQLMKDPNTGQITGVDHDIWEAIGKQLNLKIEWTEEAGWGNFIEGLRTHHYDAFCSNLWADYARSKYLSLSIPFMYSFVQTFVRADDHRFDNNIDMINDSSVTVPAIEGDVTMMMAQTRFPKAKILTLTQIQGVSDIFMAIQTGKVDAAFLDPAMFRDFDKANPGKLRQLENVPPSFTFASYYSFNTGDYQLRDMVNIALRTLLDNGTIEKIAHSYSPDYIIANKNYGAAK